MYTVYLHCTFDIRKAAMIQNMTRDIKRGVRKGLTPALVLNQAFAIVDVGGPAAGVALFWLLWLPARPRVP